MKDFKSSFTVNRPVMACLISNKSFTFIREGVKNNMVHFLYGSKRVYVTFISRCKYFEVVCSCDPTSQDSIHHECTGMNYSSYMDYLFAFHEGRDYLGVVDEADSIPEVIVCLFNLNCPQAVVLCSGHLILFGQVMEILLQFLLIVTTISGFRNLRSSTQGKKSLQVS